ncbi:response regulator [Paenibacillus tarimensis]
MTTGPLKVLVVDDEIPLRQELRVFPWESCDAVLIGEAENGEEALRICQAYAPDVVVTDITMPIMDGMTLVRELRQRYPDIQIILLTCHSDFKYAQEALKQGAVAYILKVSMEEEELMQALHKARQAMMKERNHRDNEKQRRRTVQAGLFRKLLDGQRPDHSEWEQLKLTGEAPYRIVRLFVETAHQAYVPVQQLQQALNELERTVPDWTAWLSIRDTEILILFAKSADAGALVHTIDGVIRFLTRRLKENLSAEKNWTVNAVVSDPFHAKEEIAGVLAGTSDWREALFYDGCAERSVFAGKPIPLSDMTDAHERDIRESLRKASWDSARLTAHILRELPVWCMKKRIRPRQLKQWLLKWQLEWLQEQKLQDLGSWNFKRLTEANTIRQLAEFLAEDIETVSGKEERTRIEIRSAKIWLKENLKQAVSLPILAEQVGLSPHYISRLFREETGESVNQYITRLRMEKAAELLKHTNMKVYEVAEEVGIPSYRYFTVTFRNWSGVAPTDYKHAHSTSNRQGSTKDLQ